MRFLLSNKTRQNVYCILIGLRLGFLHNSPISDDGARFLSRHMHLNNNKCVELDVSASVWMTRLLMVGFCTRSSGDCV